MTGICDLPSTHLAFEQRFSTEVACIEYLRRQRWPNGFHCPRCAGRRAWALRSRALDQCASCGHQVSLTAVTVFHGTRKPLVLWFRVIGQFLVSKSGCSAVDVSRQHGLKYETAWTWLHKLRSCMSQFGRDRSTVTSKWTRPTSAARTTTLIKVAASLGTRRRSPLPSSMETK